MALYTGWTKLAGLRVWSAFVWTIVRVHPRNVLARHASGATPWHVSAGNKRPTQNWHGPGESDCLIKTKHCAAPCGLRRNVISAQ